MKKNLMKLTILLAIFLTSCSLSAKSPNVTPATGIRITQMETAIGGSEANPNEQVFSYDLTLFNAEPVAVVIHWIEPVLAGEISRRVLTTDRRIMVEKTLAPNKYLQISGKFHFDASGVSKTQIISWGPTFTGFTVFSEITLTVEQ